MVIEVAFAVWVLYEISQPDAEAALQKQRLKERGRGKQS